MYIRFLLIYSNVFLLKLYVNDLVQTFSPEWLVICVPCINSLNDKRWKIKRTSKNRRKRNRDISVWTLSCASHLFNHERHSDLILCADNFNTAIRDGVYDTDELRVSFSFKALTLLSDHWSAMSLAKQYDWNTNTTILCLDVTSRWILLCCENSHHLMSTEDILAKT